MQSKFKLVLPLVFASVLSGCWDSLPEMSDTQILQLFAGGSLFSSSDVLPTVSKGTEECVRLISGIDKEIYRDMPEQIAGPMKTGCRKDITARLSDPKLNPMKLTLQQVETIAFAERLTKIRADAEVAAKEAAEAKQKREKAEQLQKKQAALDQIKTKLAQTKSRLEGLLNTAATLCAQSKAEESDLEKSSKRADVPSFWTPLCASDFTDRARQALAGVEENISKMEVDGDSWHFPSDPYYGNADTQMIDDELAKLTAHIKAMEAL
ncbi:hypothetical protein Brsp05_04426 [Brucella sp. NBRC 12953]|uniref:hypothetical protein n=1 Tax=Brucella sp. NBRC 12953 TaxID=3075481 RepID=UPI0030A67051